jgi:hypothetical protein
MSYIAAGLAVASIGTAGYGMYKSSKAEDAAKSQQGQGTRNYAAELLATLKAQKGAAEKLYNLEARYQPQYANLYLTTAIEQAPKQRAFAQSQQGIYNQLMQRQRAQEMATLANVAPGYIQQFLSAMPGVGDINAQLVAQAQEGLAAGRSVTPEEERAAQQSARAAYAARGVGLGDQAALAEVLNRYQFADQREAQRRAFAQQAMAQSAALSQPALARVLGAETAPLAYGVSQQALQQSMQAGPRLFNPESAYAGNLYNANTQLLMANQAAQNQAAANTAAAYGQLAGSLMGAAGSYYGANAGAAQAAQVAPAAATSTPTSS